jgi:hypothetical protein
MIHKQLWEERLLIPEPDISGVQQPASLLQEENGTSQEFIALSATLTLQV